MFGRKSYIGISISENKIKATKVKAGRRRHAIRAHGIEELAEGIIENGKIMDEDALLNALQRLRRRGKFKRKQVNLALPEGLAMVRYIHLPSVSRSKLKKMIDFEVKHNMFLPYDDPFYDYIILPAAVKTTPAPQGNEERTHHVQKQSRIMLVTASRSAVMQYVSLLRKAKFKVKSIELDSIALYRFLLKMNRSLAKRTFMILNIADDKTDVSIFNQGYVNITRSIEFNLTLAPATTYQAEFNQLASELERIISFYTYSMNNRNDEIDAIYVFGDTEHLDEVSSYIHTFLQKKVVLASDIGFASPVILNNMYAVPIGLSLKGAM